MNNQDLLTGFKRCRREIEDLKKINQTQKLELDSMNKVLKAINNNRASAPESSFTCSDSVTRSIDETIEHLQGRVEREHIEDETEKKEFADRTRIAVANASLKAIQLAQKGKSRLEKYLEGRNPDYNKGYSRCSLVDYLSKKEALV